jgi:hypothetical protein
MIIAPPGAPARYRGIGEEAFKEIPVFTVYPVIRIDG